MVMYANEMETKEKLKLPEIKNTLVNKRVQRGRKVLSFSLRDMVVRHSFGVRKGRRNQRNE